MRPIDADALSEKLCKTTVFIKYGEVFQRMINDAPTVSAEPKTGEWETDMVYAGIEFYRCDQCDFRQSEKSRYCPNCGARMTKGGDDE